MSEASAFGFGKFIPGFDFLQNLSKAGQGSGAGAIPPFGHWVAPTVSVEEIEKRIDELKAVQFWLEQNSKALSATVQALEVQRMTLSTLKGMNVNLGDLGKAFPFATASAADSGAAKPAQASPLADWPMSAPQASAPPEPVPPAASVPPEAPGTDSRHPAADTPENLAQAANMAQAMQWWGALTQQFQHIAQQVMQDPAQQQAMLKATQMGSEFAQTAVKTASDMVRQAVDNVPAAAASERASTSAAKAAKKSSVKAVEQSPGQAAAPRKTPAKTTIRAEKQAPAAASKAKPVAAKKSSASKPRSR